MRAGVHRAAGDPVQGLRLSQAPSRREKGRGTNGAQPRSHERAGTRGGLPGTTPRALTVVGVA